MLLSGIEQTIGQFLLRKPTFDGVVREAAGNAEAGFIVSTLNPHDFGPATQDDRFLKGRPFAFGGQHQLAR